VLHIPILNVLPNGKSVEVGLTGKEGFVGLPLVVGYRTSPNQAMVQIEGAAFRLKAEALVQLLRQCPVLEKRLQRYVQNLAMQGTQVAACNRIHEVDEKLARWLLMCQDRIGSDAVGLTQEFLAHMLGTRLCQRYGRGWDIANGRPDSIQPRPSQDPRPR
jgi:CRP-like cAMP-binding protein